MIELLLIVVFCLLGVLMGMLTGLLPGLHVNNIALILLSFSGVIVGASTPLFAYGISEDFVLLLIAGFIVAVSVSHTFHDFIPTTFIGAPEEDTALSVLPAHSLLLKGQGYRAVSLSVLGSFGAIIVCLCVLVPVRLVIGPPLLLYDLLQDSMAWVLIAIALLMLGTEKTKLGSFQNKYLPSVAGMLFAFFVFVLSGVFGSIILEFVVESPLGLDAPVLFPALSGLFGMPTLLNSLFDTPSIPTQQVKPLVLQTTEKKPAVLSIITGSFAGILVSIIPGITSATGTILAMNARGASGEEQTIVTLSAVNTASSFSVIAVLFIILRPRSGAAIAVNDLIAVEAWTSMMAPYGLFVLLIFLVFSGGLAYFSTLVVGGFFAQKFNAVPYRKLVVSTILLIVLLVFLFTGWLGLLVLVAATTIGFLPLLWGIRRSHCMGVLLIPIIVHFLG